MPELSPEDQIKQLKKQVDALTSLAAKNRKNQRRTEYVMYGFLGFLIVIVFGIRYQDGTLSFAIPAELVAAAVASVPVVLKVLLDQDDSKGKTDEANNSGGKIDETSES